MKKDNPNIFLGGTCNDSTWRERLIKDLKVPYFNPVVKDWNEEAQKKEVEQRKTAKFVLYVITPLMKGVYSIAEVVQDSNLRPETTIFCVLEKDDNKEFDKSEMKSLNQVKELVKKNGAKVFDSLSDIAKFLNNQEDKDKMKKLAGVS
jgi:hypothetical protein